MEKRLSRRVIDYKNTIGKAKNSEGRKEPGSNKK